MASKTWYFTGTCKWAKVVEPDKKYNKYSIDLFMDNDNMEKFKKSGAQLKVRENDEGETFITFSRPTASLGRDGKIKEHGAPLLLSVNGDPLKDTLVGNGSTVTVKVDVYDTPKGKGTRLEAVRVDNLVAFTKREVDEDIEVPF